MCETHSRFFPSQSVMFVHSGVYHRGEVLIVNDPTETVVIKHAEGRKHVLDFNSVLTMEEFRMVNFLFIILISSKKKKHKKAVVVWTSCFNRNFSLPKTKNKLLSFFFFWGGEERIIRHICLSNIVLAIIEY